MNKITIFYDGACPLCVAEMTKLKESDSRGFIDLIDINLSDFNDRHPEINREKALKILHGKLSDGSILLGLDVTHYAWKSVGKHRWIALIRMPVLKQISDLIYLAFAHNRYWLSFLFTGKKRCDVCTISKNEEKTLEPTK